ncbi:MAG: class I SAM-dependent methyltransferase [Gemmatimonadaceae bacterium]
MTSPATLSVPLSNDVVRSWYDAVGSGIERAERHEGRAKAIAMSLLKVVPGAHGLNVGVGAGHEQRRLQDAAGSDALVVGVDVSSGMLNYARQRMSSTFCKADIRALPFRGASFDFVFSAYVLDLLPTDQLLDAVIELRRALRPGGRMVLVSLTEGVDVWSRTFIAVWKWRYRLSPALLGGCRPLRLRGIAERAGFTVVDDRVVVQRGFPSEIIVAE